MAKPSLNGEVLQQLHWGGECGGKQRHGAGHSKHGLGLMKGWHTFGLWWKPDEYVFYVDGKETWRSKAGGVCQVPLFIKLSDEIGTPSDDQNDLTDDIRKAKLPDQFLVDYVRVYDLVDR